jgi:hypothetical protein
MLRILAKPFVLSFEHCKKSAERNKPTSEPYRLWKPEPHQHDAAPHRFTLQRTIITFFRVQYSVVLEKNLFDVAWGKFRWIIKEINKWVSTPTKWRRQNLETWWAFWQETLHMFLKHFTLVVSYRKIYDYCKRIQKKIVKVYILYSLVIFQHSAGDILYMILQIHIADICKKNYTIR